MRALRPAIQVQGIFFRKINGKIQYLLLKRIKERFWQPVTGCIEEGETEIEALGREVREETGIKNIVRIMKDIHNYGSWGFYKQPRVIKYRGFPEDVS